MQIVSDMKHTADLTIIADEMHLTITLYIMPLSIMFHINTVSISIWLWWSPVSILRLISSVEVRVTQRPNPCVCALQPNPDTSRDTFMSCFMSFCSCMSLIVTRSVCFSLQYLWASVQFIFWFTKWYWRGDELTTAEERHIHTDIRLIISTLCFKSSECQCVFDQVLWMVLLYVQCFHRIWWHCGPLVEENWVRFKVKPLNVGHFQSKIMSSNPCSMTNWMLCIDFNLKVDSNLF